MSRNDRGSVLVLTLVLLSTLTIAILTFAGWNASRLKERWGMERQTFYTAEAGVDYACYDIRRVQALKDSGGIIKQGDSLAHALPLTVMDEATLIYYPFADSALGYTEVTGLLDGGFLKVTSTGHYKRLSKTLSVWLGTRMPPEFEAGLIITGEPRVTVLGGTVEGAVRAIQEPIPAGSFMEFTPLKRKLPEFNAALFKTAMAKLLESVQRKDSGQSVIGELVSYNFSRRPDFSKDSILHHGGNVLINGDRFGQTLVIEGPGIIESGSQIQVSGETTLKNLTLVAQGDIACFDNAKLINCILLSYRRVHLGGKTQFDGTVYSNGTLEILNEAEVKPFATLFVAGRGGGQSNRVVMLDENVKVSGTLLVSSPSGVVFVGYESVFNGIIYTTGSVDIRGLVNGAVAALGFMARADEAKPFANAFIDGRINRQGLPHNYAAPLGLLVDPNFEVARWESHAQ